MTAERRLLTLTRLPLYDQPAGPAPFTGAWAWP